MSAAPLIPAPVPLRSAGSGARIGPRLHPYLILFLVSFPLWYLGMRLRGGQGLFDHSPIDQHTRQAQAWLTGRSDLEDAPEYLEIARYAGRYYDSFPPVPSLVELPLVLIFGANTPNALCGIYGFWLLALCAQHAVLRRRGFTEGAALLVPLAFVFATNLYASCVRASVWAYGQSLGFCLAVLGLPCVVLNPRRGLRGPGPGYALLALAVGCRPLLLLLAPLFLALDHLTSGRRLARAASSALLWMAPVGLCLAAYNWARFGSPLEFGHNHLAWAEALPEGIFSLSHVPWNAEHAFLRLPGLRPRWPYLEFDGAGTAFWLNNAILVVAVVELARVRFEPGVRAAAAFALLATLFGVLSYEGKGNAQFGFRYVVDLLPAAFVAFAFAARRFTRGMLLVSLFSFALNLYGLAVWKERPRARAARAAPLPSAAWGSSSDLGARLRVAPSPRGPSPPG